MFGTRGKERESKKERERVIFSCTRMREIEGEILKIMYILTYTYITEGDDLLYCTSEK